MNNLERLGRAAIAAGSVCVIALFGCASGATEPDETVAKTESAFTEAACGTDRTGAPGTTYVIDHSVYGGCPGSDVAHTSGTTYGDAACTHAFIVQYGAGISGAVAAVSWAGPALTASNCSSAAVQWYLYDALGKSIGSGGGSGTWTPGGTSGSFSYGPGCGFPEGSVTLNGNNVRLVTQAYFYKCSGKTCPVTSYEPVSVETLTPPC